MNAPTLLSADREEIMREFSIGGCLFSEAIAEIDYLREQLLNARLKITELEEKV